MTWRPVHLPEDRGSRPDQQLAKQLTAACAALEIGFLHADHPEELPGAEVGRGAFSASRRRGLRSQGRCGRSGHTLP
ncbi:hypothetical protein ACFXGI_27750 [Streptomyces sp. NPDC059355]|uniref:hypothetical protein n=1 Tax=Streptomyces sp. NPDC059355 TaxID=3346811 RepID=UPI0036CCA23D